MKKVAVTFNPAANVQYTNLFHSPAIAHTTPDRNVDDIMMIGKI